MEKLDESDENGHGRNTKINHIAPIFDYDNEEGTKHRTKPKTPIIVLNENKEEDKKVEQNEDNPEDKYGW